MVALAVLALGGTLREASAQPRGTLTIGIPTDVTTLDPTMSPEVNSLNVAFSVMEPLLAYITQVETERPNDYVTVILPEFVPARWWQHLLHNQSALLIKGALLFRPNTVVTSVPFHLER